MSMSAQLRVRAGGGPMRRCLLLATAALLAAGSATAFADDPPQAPQPPRHATAAKPAPAAKRALDLHAPPVDHVLTRAEMQSLVAEPDDENAPPPDDVTVSGAHLVEPIPGGVMAIPWALLHPLEAWRIFAPVTGD